jgi:Na+-transporting methylmalonyl-CoA/oxaloacetate decarboxylase gamma subunit
MSNILVFILGMIFCFLLILVYLSYKYNKYKQHICDNDPEKEKRKRELVAETIVIKKRVIELRAELIKLSESCCNKKEN